MIEEIRNFLDWGCRTLGRDHQVGGCGFRSCDVTLAAAFFLDFPAAGLATAVDLVSSFLGLAVFLVAVNLGCLDDSVSG